MVEEVLQKLKESYNHLHFGPFYHEGAKLSLQEKEWSEGRGSIICYFPFCDHLLLSNIVSPEPGVQRAETTAYHLRFRTQPSQAPDGSPGPRT